MNRELLSTTPVNAPGGRAPLFETDLRETLGIRKFLVMSLEDIRIQLERASRDRSLHPKRFRSMKVNSLVLTTWLTSALEMVDGMLGAAAPTQETEQ
jgi:hypothetical protein